MPEVQLVDLELIRRYSLAIRQESADVGEVLRILEADLARLKKAAAPKRAAKALGKTNAASKAAPTRGTTKGSSKSPAKRAR